MNKCILITLILICAGCNQGKKWQTVHNDFATIPKDLTKATKHIATDRPSQLILLTGGAASWYIRDQHDDRIANHFDGGGQLGRDLDIAIGTAGNPFWHFGIFTASYLAGLELEHDRTREVSFSTIKALGLTSIITNVFKCVNDYGPNGEPRAWPSWHTASSVTVATVMNEYYGPKVGLPLYLLSGAVMYERMDTREHWASDLAFGAAIGYTVGKAIAGADNPQIFGMDLVPTISPYSGAVGLVLTKDF
ncbi:MAG: phosphatase PAP2 family protein [Phycisphaerae bacterium]|nr:phosphatase PAP2 family protein [Phycisphaerae bacterium]